MENLVADKLVCVIIHAGANDITNAINFLNSVKKMVKTVKKNFSNTKFIFSSILIRKKCYLVNGHLKHYCQQT